MKLNLVLAKKHMRRCSTSLNIREMKIKATMKCHFTPINTTTVKRAEINKCWPGCRELELWYASGGNIKWYSQSEQQRDSSNNVTEKLELPNFPGGPVVKNRPASAGDMGSIPGPGRSHMPQNNQARVPHLLKPLHPKARGPQQEKPPQREACTPHLE